MTQVIEIIDPRDIDGDPFEAAGQALDHIALLVKTAAYQLSSSYPVVRNAAMERALVSPRADLAEAVKNFEDGPQAKALAALDVDLASVHKRLQALALAASYDPSNPLEADDA
jgi:hypothetical protein